MPLCKRTPIEAIGAIVAASAGAVSHPVLAEAEKADRKVDQAPPYAYGKTAREQGGAS